MRPGGSCDLVGSVAGQLGADRRPDELGSVELERLCTGGLDAGCAADGLALLGHVLTLGQRAALGPAQRIEGCVFLLQILEDLGPREGRVDVVRTGAPRIGSHLLVEQEREVEKVIHGPARADPDHKGAPVVCLDGLQVSLRQEEIRMLDEVAENFLRAESRPTESRNQPHVAQKSADVQRLQELLGQSACSC
jgi:hypothetical protein